jgi:hypothetical protein
MKGIKITHFTKFLVLIAFMILEKIIMQRLVMENIVMELTVNIMNYIHKMGSY